MHTQKIIASSGNIKGIEKLINEWFFSEHYKVNDDGEIINTIKKQTPDGYRIIKKRKRFYFVKEVMTEETIRGAFPCISK